MKIQRRQRYPILIYMLGFFLGIIYLNVASTRYVVDVGIWSEWFRSQYLGYDLKSCDYALAYADTMVNEDGTIKKYKLTDYGVSGVIPAKVRS